MPFMPQPESQPVRLLPLLVPQSRARQFALALLCWIGVVLLEASQFFLGDVSQHYVLSIVHYLVWPTFEWFAMALLTPLIYELGRRYPIIGPRASAHLIPHLFLCLACMVVQAISFGVVGWLYTLHHEVFAPAAILAGKWVEGRGMFGFVAYWLIVLIAGFAQMREEMRRRELHQAQLETRLASAELEKLRMQIQPHFLFNTLQAAITLVQEDPNAAEDVLLRLSGLLRIALDQMDVNEIPLSRELEFLDLYVGIQQRRFGERLAVEIHADSSTLDLLVPPLILQPLVENAIRHGIGKHKGDDCVEIFARQEDGNLQIEVWNANSVVDQTGERLFQSGVGLRNTRARLEQLYGSAASFLFRSLARGGAAAILVIPARPSLHTEAHSAAGAAL